MSWLWSTALALAAPLSVGWRVHRLGRSRAPLPQEPLTAVVLGARVYPDGTPSPALLDRVTVGVRLLREGKARRLVLTGGTPDARPTEASVMAGIARSLGAAEADLVLEEKSRSTYENALHTTALLGRGERVLLVSCDFHLARAAAYFRDAGLQVHPVASLRSLGAATRLMVTAREVAGLLRRPRLLAHL